MKTEKTNKNIDRDLISTVTNRVISTDFTSYKKLLSPLNPKHKNMHSCSMKMNAYLVTILGLAT